MYMNAALQPAGPPALRILIAESSLINRKVEVMILERLGYTADVADNGLEALEALERQPYDIVLMGRRHFARISAIRRALNGFGRTSSIADAD